MPNIKSAEKRVQLTKVQNARNKAQKSELKTYLKKFDAAIAQNDQAAVNESYKVAVKAVDRAVTKGLIHKNNAAHKKSSLTLKLNAFAK